MNEIKLTIYGLGFLGAILILLRPFYINRPWLFKKQIKLKKFDRLWFNKSRKAPEYNHFQGLFHFHPTNSTINIFIDSDKAAIDSKQLIFIDEIEIKYEEICSKCVKILENKYGLIINNFNQDFILDSLELNRSQFNNQDWRLYFFSKKYNFDKLIIEFNNWDIQSLKN